MNAGIFYDFQDCRPVDQADVLRAAGVLANGPEADLERTSAVAFVSLSYSDAADRIAHRKEQGKTVIALTTPPHATRRRAALDAGTDEFLACGPVIPADLAARTRWFAHGSSLPDDCALDVESGTLRLAGRIHPLSTREARLVAPFLAARGGFVTHADLLNAVWGPNAKDRQYLRVAINAIRTRIEPEPALPRFLLNEPAIGYRFGTGEAAWPPAHL